MGASKLKEALNDCLINFDRRVLLTDLLNEYHMPIEDVSRTLTDYLSQQEKDGVKYEKRYVVHGMEADDPTKEVFKIVKGESKLNEWLKKLESAESSLYSVEVEGGAKPPAEDLRPVTWCAIKLEDLQTRKGGAKHMNGNAKKSKNADEAVKVETRTETKPGKGIADAFAKTKPKDNTSDTTTAKGKKEAGTSTSKASSADTNKISPQNNKSNTEDDPRKKSPQKSAEQKKLSPKDRKAAAAAAASGQKGIGNFFAPKNKGAADATNKATTGVIRQKSPKKLNDFFKKKGDEHTVPKEAVKQEEMKTNTSMQLFAEDEEEEEEQEKREKDIEKKAAEVLVESSDEEEELNKLRREVEDADKEEAATSSRKRLRIEDSDDEEDEEDEEPQQKQGKLDEPVVAEVEDSPPKSETYLDEDGFVITVKSKKPHSKPVAPATSRQKTPTKSNPKDIKTKQTPSAVAKTKQGNIMNFFKKK